MSKEINRSYDLEIISLVPQASLRKYTGEQYSERLKCFRGLINTLSLRGLKLSNFLLGFIKVYAKMFSSVEVILYAVLQCSLCLHIFDLKVDSSVLPY